MLWFVITSPTFFPDEAAFIHRLFANGVDIVHLRKPGATAEECARLLDGLTSDNRRRIVIHDFFELVQPYGLKGIHLNARRSTVPDGYEGHVSRSCHSLEEVKRYKSICGYVFLSPIFDSVSKQGYASAFTDETLKQASSDGVIDGKVVALGGVTPDKISYLRQLGFGGAAMLGCVNNLSALPGREQEAALETIRRNIVDEP